MLHISAIACIGLCCLQINSIQNTIIVTVLLAL